MYINFASDWPAYIFMAAFVVFMVYVIVKGHGKEDVSANAVSDTKK
ncbi:MAG: hypothetical protein FWD54_05175 [Endomicrobia bacterium]|nr:hypothetical protein [Endomicrobiia bacterium]MCL2799643.1 hypothetical protein [Endomicrobiia bacterium]